MEEKKEFILRVDEKVQGWDRKFSDMEELKKAVMELLDESVEEIKITRTPITRGKQVEWTQAEEKQEVLEKKVADLEKIIQKQQGEIDSISEILVAAGADRMYLPGPHTQSGKRP